MNTVDLTQRPPRSPRVTLGGYVIPPRMLDKGRAQLAGKAGDYHFNCSLDQRFESFAGVNSEDILQLLKEGKSDSEILAWIRKHGKISDFEIVPWSQFQLQRCPSDNEGREFVSNTVQKLAPIGTMYRLFSICSTWTISSPSGERLNREQKMRIAECGV